VKIAYLDTFAGISGDMTVGALLQLGLPLAAVREAVTALGLDGVELAAEQVVRSGITAVKFHVRVHGEPVDEAAAQAAGCGDAHEHDSPPGPPSDPPAHPHPHAHRAYRDIRAQIAGSALAPRVKTLALEVFARLAEAEGRVHGKPADDVSFHEVGAADALVDIVGAVVGFVHLGVDVIHAAPLPMGTGRVRAAHGPLPVPAPAVTELVRGRAVRFEDGTAELVTPTGAAIVAALARPEPVPTLRITAVGWGSGSRELPDRPNLLRIVVGDRDVAAASEDVVVLEATIDDLPPQIYEHVLERLLACGARDAFLVPVVMKKSRPGTLLRVLADPAARERLAAIVFAETSTIGLRWTTWRRTVLARTERSVETPWGSVRVKVAHAPDGTPNIAPEFEDCRRLAREHGVALKLVHQAALAAAVRER
jgi:uncharacterized protein (TIGR00299 family) protein